jgi:tRNA(fMet)-specific endonuclease VapC
VIVADTEVLIDYLAGSEPMAGRIESELAAGRLATTVISRFELLTGARGVRQERAVRGLLDAVETLPLDIGAADRAAELRRDLERAGRGIAMADSLIAGIVLERGALLLSRNVRHFERVPGLRLAKV